MTTEDDFQQAFDDYFSALADIDRHARPDGGALTWEGLGALNSARWTLSEATGIDYQWLLRNGF